MALSFGNTQGAAQKDRLNNYKFEEGINTVRLVGDIVARYVYWIKGENDKAIPFECLSFDRQTEAFTNMEKDWVREFFPREQCGWAYASLCIHNGELKIVNHKKKLFQQIILAAEDLGDPTDIEKGWGIVYDRQKTGPKNYNVEYNLLPLKCKSTPLTDEERAIIKDIKSMDEVLTRPTPDAQKSLLMRITGKEEEKMSDAIGKHFDGGDDDGTDKVDFSTDEKF